MNGRRSGIVQTENTARHTKYGRIRGMVVGEGGRSTGVLLYTVKKSFIESGPWTMVVPWNWNLNPGLSSLMTSAVYFRCGLSK